MQAELQRLARDVRGFMPHVEGLALWRAAAGLTARRGSPGTAPASASIVEIGSYCGKSTTYLGAAAKATGQIVFTVDHHRGSEEMQPGTEHHDPAVVDPTTGDIDSLPHLRDTLSRAGLESVVNVVVGESVEVAARWQGPIAMLFIDGGHAAQVAHADYDAWTRFVEPGGTLAIHDVFANPALGGRPPYELYLRALSDGFAEVACCGSLRVLRLLSPP